MTCWRLAVLVLAGSSFAASMSWGQSYKIEVETKLYKSAPANELPEKVAFQPIGTFERTEIEFSNQQPAYGDNYWGKTDLGRDKTELDGPLVYYYKMHDIHAMRQRVAEADVVDETASFPVPRSSCSSISCGCCCGFGRRGFHHVCPSQCTADTGLTVKTVDESESRSRYDDMPHAAKSNEGYIVVDYAESELLGVAP